jgi:hypothetical protein
VGDVVVVSNERGAVLKGQVFKVRSSKILEFSNKEYCDKIVLDHEGNPKQGTSHVCDHCMHGCIMREGEIGIIDAGMKL